MGTPKNSSTVGAMSSVRTSLLISPDGKRGPRPASSPLDRWSPLRSNGKSSATVPIRGERTALIGKLCKVGALVKLGRPRDPLHDFPAGLSILEREQDLRQLPAQRFVLGPGLNGSRRFSPAQIDPDPARHVVLRHRKGASPLPGAHLVVGLPPQGGGEPGQPALDVPSHSSWHEMAKLPGGLLHHRRIRL